MRAICFRSGKPDARGWTLIEAVVALAVAGLMAAASAELAVPVINQFFLAPSLMTLYAASSDVTKIITEGDAAAKGLRFAGTSTPIKGAAGNSLTYQYRDGDDTSDTSPTSVTLTYDPANKVVMRSVDGGAPAYVPYFVKPGGLVEFSALGASFFEYYDSSGAQLSEPITVASIRQVVVGFEAAILGGQVSLGGGKTRLKTGVYIKPASTLIE